MGINVGPWVLDFSQFGQDWRNDLVDVADKLEEWIIGQMLEGELALAGITRICFTEDSMTVAGNDLARFQCLPDEVLDLVFVSVVSEFSAQLLQPNEYFLVGQTVQWSSETVQTGSK